VLSAVRNIQDGEFDIDDGGMRLFAVILAMECGEFRQCQITKSTRLRKSADLSFWLTAQSRQREIW
jgi:hypothetical protein